MPPIVPHPQLQRTFSVLRAQYDSGSDLDHQKIVGSHLILGKRSSTPASSLQHSTLSATASLLSAAVAQSKMAPVCRSPDSAAIALFNQANIDMNSALGVTNLHRRLDRSHSEPVWQQQPQFQDARQGSNSSRYKTELCRPFEENGFCKYGDKCQFAHGSVELRTLNRHPKYKTELCRTFHTIGFCPYGPRCHFIHNAEESRVLSPIMSSAPINPALLQSHLNSTLPPLVPSTGNNGHHNPLSIIPSMGLPTIFDKNSPPSSLNGSPTTPASFFDELNVHFLQGQLVGGLADTLNSLSLNDDKITVNENNNLVNLNNAQIFNYNLKNHCSSPTNSIGSSNISNNSSDNNTSPNNSFGELLCDGTQQLLSNMDTPPASPPDTSPPSFAEDPNNPLNSSIRLPIFQSINLMQ